MKRFEGKVIGITGSARGIGQAMAVRFASEGGSIAIMDIADTSATALTL